MKLMNNSELQKALKLLEGAYMFKQLEETSELNLAWDSLYVLRLAVKEYFELKGKKTFDCFDSLQIRVAPEIVYSYNSQGAVYNSAAMRVIEEAFLFDNELPLGNEFFDYNKTRKNIDSLTDLEVLKLVHPDKFKRVFNSDRNDYYDINFNIAYWLTYVYRSHFFGLPIHHKYKPIPTKKEIQKLIKSLKSFSEMNYVGTPICVLDKTYLKLMEKLSLFHELTRTMQLVFGTFNAHMALDSTYDYLYTGMIPEFMLKEYKTDNRDSWRYKKPNHIYEGTGLPEDKDFKTTSAGPYTYYFRFLKPMYSTYLEFIQSAEIDDNTNEKIEELLKDTAEKQCASVFGESYGELFNTFYSMTPDVNSELYKSFSMKLANDYAYAINNVLDDNETFIDNTYQFMFKMPTIMDKTQMPYELILLLALFLNSDSGEGWDWNGCFLREYYYNFRRNKHKGPFLASYIAKYNGKFDVIFSSLNFEDIKRTYNYKSNYGFSRVLAQFFSGNIPGCPFDGEIAPEFRTKMVDTYNKSYDFLVAEYGEDIAKSYADKVTAYVYDFIHNSVLDESYADYKAPGVDEAILILERLLVHYDTIVEHGIKIADTTPGHTLQYVRKYLLGVIPKSEIPLINAEIMKEIRNIIANGYEKLESNNYAVVD